MIVATDDMRIAETAFSFGAEVALTSPKHASGTDRIAEVAARLDGVKYLINVQGDEPLIDPKLISRLAQTLANDDEVEMITAADAFEPGADLANPNAVKVVVDRKSNALYFSRSPIPFAREPGLVPAYRHQGIYGYSRKFLLRFVKWKPGILERTEQLEQLRALENGAKIRVLVAKQKALGVDTPEDVAVVEKLLGASVPAASPQAEVIAESA